VSRRSIVLDHPPDELLPEPYEGFVQAVARGVPAGRAYGETFGKRTSGGITPDSAKSNAWRVLKGSSGPVLQQRIEHIRGELARSSREVPDRPDPAVVRGLLEEVTSSLSSCHELAVAALAPPELLARLRKTLSAHVARLGRVVWNTSESLPEPPSVPGRVWNLALVPTCFCGREESL